MKSEKCIKVSCQKSLCIFFVIEIQGLFSIRSSYYKFFSLHTFLNQVSQFRPSCQPIFLNSRSTMGRTWVNHVLLQLRSVLMRPAMIDSGSLPIHSQIFWRSANFLFCMKTLYRYSCFTVIKASPAISVLSFSLNNET